MSNYEATIHRLKKNIKPQQNSTWYKEEADRYFRTEKYSIQITGWAQQQNRGDSGNNHWIGR